jgi:hypothetical protein
MPSSSFTTASILALTLVATMCSPLILPSQESAPQLSPRELYYREPVPDQEKRAPHASLKKHVVDNGNGESPTTANGSLLPKGSAEEVTGANPPSVEKTSTSATKPEVSHLGLRYSLLLVDKNTGNARPVSSSQTFEQGECLSLEFQSNRSGYLYVFNLGSSGAWKPMLPTVEMSDEGNFVPALTTMRVPATHCFRISGPPGEEHLFVVLSRNPQEVNELNRSIRDGAASEPKPPCPPDTGKPVLTMASNLNQEVQKIASLRGRDLEVQEVGGVQNSGAPPTDNPSAPGPAMYVVHTSATPSDKVVTEIDITHR